MTRELRIEAGALETRAALIEDGRLAMLWRESTLGGDDPAAPGAIVAGRIVKVVPSIEAAFVDIGAALPGFLPLRELRGLTEGARVIVQVVKPPRPPKGAQLTNAINLNDVHLVLTPDRPGVAYSRRVDVDARARLGALALPLAHGYLFRTSAAHVDDETLVAEASALAAQWTDIAAKAEHAQPPAILSSAPDLAARLLRDHAGTLDCILTDDAAMLNYLRARIARFPGLAPAPEIVRPPEGVLDDWRDEIAGLSHRRAELTGGGWISFDTLDAMTVIDVNAGGFPDARERDETASRVNLAAAAALPRQIRLRGIGGLIVVDFIQMRDANAREAVMATLRAGFAADPAAVEIQPMSPSGLVEIARARIGIAIAPVTETCACCGGAGHMPDTAALAIQLSDALEREARARPGLMRVVAAPALADYLASRLADLMPHWQRRGIAGVTIVSDASLSQGGFHAGRA